MLGVAWPLESELGHVSPVRPVTAEVRAACRSATGSITGESWQSTGAAALVLSMVRQTATDRERAVQLLDSDDACQLVWQRRSSKRQLVLARRENARVDPFRASNDESRFLWSTFFHLGNQLSKSFARDLLSIAIERDQRPALRRSSDAIPLALTNLGCRTAPQWFVLDHHNLKLGEFADPGLVIRGSLCETTARTPDDHEPKRGYASRWSSPTSGRSRMLSRADHLS